MRISNTGQDFHIPVSSSTCVGEVRSKVLELISDSGDHRRVFDILHVIIFVVTSAINNVGIHPV